MNIQQLPTDALQKRFKKFADQECKGGRSELYYAMAMRIAEDKELLSLAANRRERQPIPNLFFAAIHYLLLQDQEHELATYYPSINRHAVEQPPFALFKAFCLEHSTAIKTIMGSRIVQTNALNRTAYLMPIFSALFPAGEPINLIDIGASAGLNLHLDNYKYHYNGEYRIGTGPVHIETEIRTGQLPPFQQMVKINRKIGIDQNPLDVKEVDNAHWLKALIWADQRERFNRIAAAVSLAQQSDLELIKAKNITDFRDVILAQDTKTPLVVYHTHVLYQFTPEERMAFREMLDQVGKQRDLYYLAVEHQLVFHKAYERNNVLIERTAYKKGKKSSTLVGITDGHANWVEWLGR